VNTPSAVVLAARAADAARRGGAARPPPAPAGVNQVKAATKNNDPDLRYERFNVATPVG
jgi:hypothetical protein